jgi:hypothetical protein
VIGQSVDVADDFEPFAPVPFAVRGGESVAALQQILKDAPWSPMWQPPPVVDRSRPVVRLVPRELPRYREGRR